MFKAMVFLKKILSNSWCKWWKVLKGVKEELDLGLVNKYGSVEKMLGLH